MKNFPDTILSSDFIPAYIREGFVKIRGRRKTRIFTNLVTKVSHPYFMGTLGLKCFVSAHKYWKLTLT